MFINIITNRCLDYGKTIEWRDEHCSICVEDMRNKLHGWIVSRFNIAGWSCEGKWERDEHPELWHKYDFDRDLFYNDAIMERVLCHGFLKCKSFKLINREDKSEAIYLNLFCYTDCIRVHGIFKDKIRFKYDDHDNFGARSVEYRWKIKA